MSERTFADAFDRWLRAEGFVFRRDRMDKATTCERGWPDFAIFLQSRALLLELKDGEKGRLSRDQQNMHAKLQAAGCKVFVCRKIEDACQIVQEWRASLPPASTPAEPNKAAAGPVSESPLRLLSWCGQTWTVSKASSNGWNLLRKADAEDLATLKPV